MTKTWHHLAHPLDGDPISTRHFALAFARLGETTFALDGSGKGFSLMGAGPIASLRISRSSTVEDLFATLRSFLAEHSGGASSTQPSSADPYPFPFRAGLVGYVGYECGQMLERLPCVARGSIGMPDLAFDFYRWVIATDRRKTHTSWISVLGFGDTDDEARTDAETVRNRVIERLASVESSPPSAPARSRRPTHIDPAPLLTRAISPADYIERINVAKDHIARGDAYEICLTNALSCSFPRRNAWELFHSLRQNNPAPFGAMLDLPEGAVVSSSPERFVSVSSGGRVVSSPIKGTRTRSSNPDDDARLAHDLATSEKDLAENAMIVDLVRNDLGRVCEFGSVKADDIFRVESFATVHQLVSTITGTLTKEHDAFDLLRAAFPPGSMTGAPKIEAMSILEKLEPVERGVYSGALGWIDISGAMDLSVVIRTIVVTNDNRATFSVGGAIVADSDPATELEETNIKARALIDAIASIQSADTTTDERAAS